MRNITGMKGHSFRNTGFYILLRDLAIVFAVIGFLLFWLSGDVEAAERMSKHCEHRPKQVSEIERRFADTIFKLWRSQSPNESVLDLYAKAEYTAWYILRDNGITCEKDAPRREH